MISSKLNIKLLSSGRLFSAIAAFMLTLSVFGQVPDGYNEFKYPSGKISSEGPMKNGQPEGYWKNYYENGHLKSEGNRLNHKLDSLWKFYDEDGILSVAVEYKNGLKHGLKKTFSKDSTLIKEELFKNDTIQLVKKFHQTGELKLKTPFQAGKKDGFAFEYDTSGLELTWWKYEEGKSEKFTINRLDNLGRKTGKWMKFQNEILIHEVVYAHGLKNGVERIYDRFGKLLEVNKYSNGQLLKDVKELQKIDLKRELGSNGLVAKSGGFNEKGEPHGVHRKYDKEGNVESSKIYDNGVIVGEGIVKKNGKKDGDWVLYYPSGKKLGEGKFKNGKKVGQWKFYFENGLLESEGIYTQDGKQDGLWKEYYSHGGLAEEINYYEGIYDGMCTVYDDSGKVVVQGNYKEDYEEGEWFYITGDHTLKGSYIEGKKTGEWRSFYNEKQITFKGSFQNGLPIGKHLYWYENGTLMKFGEFRSGRKSGVWTTYTSGGKVLMITEYVDGLERKINGYTIDPAHEPEDYVEYEATGYE